MRYVMDLLAQPFLYYDGFYKILICILDEHLLLLLLQKEHPILILKLGILQSLKMDYFCD